MAESPFTRDQMVLDSWSTLIEGADSEAESIYDVIEGLIGEAGVTNIEVRRVSLLREEGFFNFRSEEYLLVSNKRIKAFQAYIGARQYGKNLYVSLYLTCEKGVLERAVSDIPVTGTSDPRLLSYLGLFKYEELKAYTTLISRCFFKAVENLMSELGKDPSRIAQRSGFFLNP